MAIKNPICIECNELSKVITNLKQLKTKTLEEKTSNLGLMNRTIRQQEKICKQYQQEAFSKYTVRGCETCKTNPSYKNNRVYR